MYQDELNGPYESSTKLNYTLNKGIMLGLYCDYTGIIVRLYWDYTEIILGFWDYTGIMGLHCDSGITKNNRCDYTGIT